METPRYYILGPGNGTNLARVCDQEYCYLNGAGRWIEHPRVFDKVFHGELPEVQLPADLTPGQALAYVSRLARKGHEKN